MPTGRKHRRKAVLDESRRRAKASPPLVAAAGAAPRRARRDEWKASDRDGLLWLLSRGRLTQRQATAAFDYQFAFRVVGGVALKSGLNPDTILSAGCGGGRSYAPAALVETPAEAKLWLFRIRWEVLRGQEQMIGVLDAVLGRGMTLREIAEGNGHMANTYEALLKAALDMVAEHLDPRIRRVG